MEITCFERDANQRQTNLQKHGVDFLYATLIFEGPILTKIDDRQDCGEVREVSLGMVDGEVYCVLCHPHAAWQPCQGHISMERRREGTWEISGKRPLRN